MVRRLLGESLACKCLCYHDARPGYDASAAVSLISYAFQSAEVLANMMAVVVALQAANRSDFM